MDGGKVTILFIIRTIVALSFITVSLEPETNMLQPPPRSTQRI
jgi:hypothetical protein